MNNDPRLQLEYDGCPHCSGKGWTVGIDRSDPSGQTPEQKVCEACAGSGFVEIEATEGRGTGAEQDTESPTLDFGTLFSAGIVVIMTVYFGLIVDSDKLNRIATLIRRLHRDLRNATPAEQLEIVTTENIQKLVKDYLQNHEQV